MIQESVERHPIARPEDAVIEDKAVSLSEVARVINESSSLATPQRQALMNEILDIEQDSTLKADLEVATRKMDAYERFAKKIEGNFGKLECEQDAEGELDEIFRSLFNFSIHDLSTMERAEITKISAEFGKMHRVDDSQLEEEFTVLVAELAAIEQDQRQTTTVDLEPTD